MGVGGGFRGGRSGCDVAVVFIRRLRVSLLAASGDLFFTTAFHWCECLAVGCTSLLNGDGAF